LVARKADLDAVNVDLVLIAVGEPASVVQPWLKARGLDGPTLVLDQFGRLARTLGGAEVEGDRETLRLPRTVVLAADGTVRAIYAEEGPDYADRILAEARRKE
jgi:hypothetical protein